MSSFKQMDLIKVLEYSPLTGNFTWLVDRGSAKKGDLYGERLKAHRLAWLYMEGYWKAEKEYGFPNCNTTSSAHDYLKKEYLI